MLYNCNALLLKLVLLTIDRPFCEYMLFADIPPLRAVIAPAFDAAAIALVATILVPVTAPPTYIPPLTPTPPLTTNAPELVPVVKILLPTVT